MASKRLVGLVLAGGLFAGPAFSSPVFVDEAFTAPGAPNAGTISGFCIAGDSVYVGHLFGWNILIVAYSPGAGWRVVPTAPCGFAVAQSDPLSPDYGDIIYRGPTGVDYTVSPALVSYPGIPGGPHVLNSPPKLYPLDIPQVGCSQDMEVLNPLESAWVLDPDGDGTYAYTSAGEPGILHVCHIGAIVTAKVISVVDVDPYGSPLGNPSLVYRSRIEILGPGIDNDPLPPDSVYIDPNGTSATDIFAADGSAVQLEVLGMRVPGGPEQNNAIMIQWYTKTSEGTFEKTGDPVMGDRSTLTVNSDQEMNVYRVTLETIPSQNTADPFVFHGVYREFRVSGTPVDEPTPSPPPGQRP